MYEDCSRKQYDIRVIDSQKTRLKYSRWKYVDFEMIYCRTNHLSSVRSRLEM